MYDNLLLKSLFNTNQLYDLPEQNHMDMMPNGKTKTYGMTADFSCSADVVFSGIQIMDNCTGIFAAAVVLCVISLLYEYTLNRKTKLLEGYLKSDNEGSFEEKIVISIYHCIQLSLLYLIMIGIMSYNCWLIFVIIISNGIGYFLFIDYERIIETCGCCNFT